MGRRQRVLITGMTALQAGRPHQLQIVSTPGIIARALAEAGHDVQHRATEPEERLSDFDVALVGITSPTSFTAGKAWTALDVIGRARVEGVALGFYVDDWRLREIGTDVGYVRRDPKRLVKSMWKDRPHYDWACENLKHLAWVIDAMAIRPWPPTIVPKFTWGDGSILASYLPSRRLNFVDPSAYAPKHNGTAVDGCSAPWKERVWVSAALPSKETRERGWLERHLAGCRWPVERYGDKKLGQPRLHEDEVVGRYVKAWGVVSVPYYHVGSGWWRVRFVHSARAGCVITADPREVVDLGDAFRIPLQEIEKLDDGGLAELAKAQCDEIQRRSWPRERLRDELDDIVRNIAAER